MKNNNPKISVVIPVLNGAATLEKCLASVLDQTFIDYEVIIVDNGSTDKTKEIMDRFIKTSDKIIYIFEAKRGRGSARNAGIAKAGAEIIAMTDADCLVPSDWLFKISAPIINEGEIAVSGFEKNAVLNYWSKMRQEADRRSIKLKIQGGHIDRLDTKNFAIRADILKKIGFNSDLLANEDWDLLLRLKKEGLKIKFLSDLLVSHYHDSSCRELIATQYSRGQAAAKIIKLYRHEAVLQEFLKNDENAKSFRFRNYLLFLPWAIWQFLRNPYEAPYLVIADLAWKIGGLSSKRLFK